MADPLDQIASLLHEAAELHHQVLRDAEGVDHDCASWYGDWLTHHSELPQLLDKAPVRNELVYMLVKFDKDYTAAAPTEPWTTYYALRGRDERTLRLIGL